MVDAVVILKALRLDYDLIEDSDGMFWHRKGSRMEGPFKNMDSAAYAALDDHQFNSEANNEKMVSSTGADFDAG